MGIVDGAVLRRPVAGIRVQIEQLRYLRECSANPTLTLQIIPFGAGGHAAPTGFAILRFAERDLPNVVYVENLDDTLLRQAERGERYLLAMERLSIVAYEPLRDTCASSTRSSPGSSRQRQNRQNSSRRTKYRFTAGRKAGTPLRRAGPRPLSRC